MKNIYILLVIVVTLLIVYLTLDFLCNVGIKCKNCRKYSLTIEESKLNGFFIATYKPLKTKYNLKYNNDSIEFTGCWVEYTWFINSNNCLFKKKEIGSGYNLTIEFKQYSPENYNFRIQGYGVGRMKKSAYNEHIYTLPDTLTFKLLERNPYNSVNFQENINTKLEFVLVK